MLRAEEAFYPGDHKEMSAVGYKQRDVVYLG
jgi:hypothetical protein